MVPAMQVTVIETVEKVVEVPIVKQVEVPQAREAGFKVRVCGFKVHGAQGLLFGVQGLGFLRSCKEFMV